MFHEYFHGDNGAGIGASHQTGWTGGVALLTLLFRGDTIAWPGADRGPARHARRGLATAVVGAGQP